jgi:adhesin transport system outer membrane protein
LVLARAQNPLVDVADADVLAAMAQHQAARQFNYPRFDLEVGGNLNHNIDGSSGANNDLSAMVRMRFNLYRGGADEARIRETAFNVNEATEVRNRSLRQLEETLRLAWAAFEATSAQVPLLQQQAAAAEATRDAYAQQFNIGQRTLLDLLNSENEVLQSRQSVVDAEVDRLLAYFRALEAMGKLVDHFRQPGGIAAGT